MKRQSKAGVVHRGKMEAKPMDEMSVASRSSRSSASSTGSLIHARAKAEVAKARAAFAEQEAKAKIKRATQEAKMTSQLESQSLRPLCNCSCTIFSTLRTVLSWLVHCLVHKRLLF